MDELTTEQRVAFLTSWHDEPGLFVEQVFGVWRWVPMEERVPGRMYQEKWQSEAMRLVATEDRIAVRSGKGVGKTCWLAWCILWYLGTRMEVKVPCTATSAHQLYDVLWAECGKWVRRMPEWAKSVIRYEVKSDRIEIVGMSDMNFAIARTARKEQPEALQGFHAENLLFVIDEGSGVDDLVYEVAEGGMSTRGAKTLMTGNPTRSSGYFYDAFHRDRGRWATLRVSCEDSSQVTKAYIEGMRAKWGEESNEFRVGVMGEFPLAQSDTIIPLYLVEQAVGRVPPREDAPVVWGVDVARFGSDRTAVARRRGRVLLGPVKAWQGKDLMQTCGMIADMYYMERVGDRPIEIMVDSIGMGAGVYDRLKELGLPVRSVNVAERPSSSDGYKYLRDELWFKAREWFAGQDVIIPDDRDMIQELVSVEYDIDSRGKRFIKNKKELGWSPDLADAFVLTFASAREKSLMNGVASNRKKAYIVSDADYLAEYNKNGDVIWQSALDRYSKPHP